MNEYSAVCKCHRGIENRIRIYEFKYILMFGPSETMNVRRADGRMESQFDSTKKNKIG